MKFINLIISIFDVFVKAREIRKDEEKRAKSVYFAVTSIAYSLVMVACAVGGSFLFGVMDDTLLFLFVVVIAATLMISAVVSLFGALLRVIVQFTINRKPMSWIALIVFLAAVGASVYFLLQI